MDHTPETRLVPRSAAEQIERRGLSTPWRTDLYHRALMLPWARFLALGSGFYLTVNVFFAGLYLLQPGSIAGARPGSFADAFFFSVQTIATIGYGQMSPGTLYANVLVTIETMVGLIFLALTTGIVFARISRPTARVMFARRAVITAYDGVQTLHIRLGNERRSQILEADVAVSLIQSITTREGTMMRRFFDLPLARSHTPIFALTFTILHTIDSSSPLYGMTAQQLEAGEAELLITVTGLEELTSQTVHARYSYAPTEILWDQRFTDIFATSEQGRRVIDYGRFHDTEPA